MKALGKLVNQAGQVTRWPTQPKEKTLVIEYLASKFSQDEEYSERDVNELLKEWHTFSDWAMLRRELFERGFLDRDKNGSSYWRTDKALEVLDQDVTVMPRRLTTQVFKLENVGVRVLTYQDVPRIQTFYVRCQDFFLFLTGEVPTLGAVKDLFEPVPPYQPKNAALYLGLFQDTLIGVLKLDRDYPNVDEWFVSLLLIEPSKQNKGLGHAVVHGLETWLKAQGVKRLSLVVVEGNQAAQRFWQREGFMQTRALPPKALGKKTHVLLEFAKDLQGD
jgi:RimJ/RimL family protein N-acetyltransferase